MIALRIAGEHYTPSVMIDARRIGACRPRSSRGGFNHGDEGNIPHSDQLSMGMVKATLLGGYT
jgi:hypothetical protein